MNTPSRKGARWLQASLYGLLSALYTLSPRALKTRIECKLLYHPSPPMVLSPKLKTKAVHFHDRSGTELFGLHFKARPGKATLLFSNGNAGRLEYAVALAQASGLLKQGYGFFAYDYPAYGHSHGQPSEASLYEAVEAASDYLKTHGCAIEKQIPLGWSLGGGVTAELASKRPFPKVILASTFSSIPDVFQAMRDKVGLPKACFPVANLLTQRFDSLHKALPSQSKLLIAHGQADTLCPVSQAQALYKHHGTERTQLSLYPNLAHNDLLLNPAFLKDLQRFVSS